MKTLFITACLLSAGISFGQKNDNSDISISSDSGDSNYCTATTVSKNDDGTYDVTSTSISTTETHEDNETPVKGKSYARRDVSEEGLTKAIVETQKEAEENVDGIAKKVNEEKKNGEGKQPESTEESSDNVIPFPDGSGDGGRMLTIVTFIKGSGPNKKFTNVPKNGVVLKYENMKDYQTNYAKDLKKVLSQF